MITRGGEKQHLQCRGLAAALSGGDEECRPLWQQYPFEDGERRRNNDAFARVVGSNVAEPYVG